MFNELLKQSCKDTLIRSPSVRYSLMRSSSSADLLLSSPPGRLTDDSIKMELRRELVSTRHLFIPTCEGINVNKTHQYNLMF